MFTLNLIIENVVRNGRKEIIEYLKSLGGSPFLNGDSWDPSEFNVSKILQLEPYHGVLLLPNYEYGKSQDVIERDNRTHRPIFKFSHYKEMLMEMFNVQAINSTYRDQFIATIDKAVQMLENYSEEVRISLKTFLIAIVQNDIFLRIGSDEVRYDCRKERFI